MKRGVGIAMQVGFGNLGGIVAAFVYRSVDAPRSVISHVHVLLVPFDYFICSATELTVFGRFVKGHVTLIGTITMSVLLTVFMTLYLRHENARRDALLVAQGFSLEEVSTTTRLEEREKGDDATFFRYTV